jgi:hypothetical protein
MVKKSNQNGQNDQSNQNGPNDQTNMPWSKKLDQNGPINTETDVTGIHAGSWICLKY